MRRFSFHRFLACFSLVLAAVNTGLALDSGVSWAVFSNGETPYIEVNIEIAGNSTTFRRLDSLQLQAKIETVILIKRGEAVVNFEKYLLTSPAMFHTGNFLDVKRFAVTPGEFELEIEFADGYDSLNTDVYKAHLSVPDPGGFYFSEIQLLRSFKPDNSDNPFTKNGYFLEPLPFNFYDRHSTILAFYAEIYNTQNVTSEPYLVRYFIEQSLGNDKSRLIGVGNRRYNPSTIDGLLVQMDISHLESGNYTLLAEIRNAKNEVLATQKLDFQRSNPFIKIDTEGLTEEVVSKQFVQHFDESTLRYSLRAIAPLQEGDNSEILKTILKEGDLKSMRFFLFDFFVRRDPNNPEQAYVKYMDVANAVDNTFRSGFGYGFETDRGRTFIKYGKPDDLVRVDDDPEAAPYEIWVYYSVASTHQTNVKFLFYNPSLAGDGFVLLHSNARGEINNPRWERDLYKARGYDGYQGDNYQDATRMKPSFNRHAREYFEDF